MINDYIASLTEGTINDSDIQVPLADLNAGPTIDNMSVSSSETSNKLSSLIDLMNQNMTYINIHTTKFPEGELRGSLTSSNGIP